MAATALRLLTKFGTSITMVRLTGNFYDPVGGTVIDGADASYSAIALIKPYPDRMIDGTRIIDGDRMLVMDSGTEPDPSDRATIGGEEWSIVSIKTVKPDDATAVVYFCQVRK